MPIRHDVASSSTIEGQSFSYACVLSTVSFASACAQKLCVACRCVCFAQVEWSSFHLERGTWTSSGPKQTNKTEDTNGVTVPFSCTIWKLPTTICSFISRNGSCPTAVIPWCRVWEMCVCQLNILQHVGRSSDSTRNACF